MDLKEYLFNQWKRNNIPKYYYLFENWFQQLTSDQKLYYFAYANNLKTPF